MRTTRKAPKHLRAPTRRWYESVLEQYDLEAHHIRLLTLACEALDRCAGAREALERHGTTYTDRWGCPRGRPEISIERDSRLAFARLLRELGLDSDAPTEEYSRAPRLTRRAGGAS